ncbi:3'-5' exonuclease [Methylomonas montana]|uniref:3'-5' exonuclease n=1 Tax=Methylomonas montana TaxID=3058963 RepID=UPI00265B2806|nr:3'-5' exonuclease [Methylomonas montana]WKJ91328.1 3'-5' exonuclease [Methylomonas montana]
MNQDNPLLSVNRLKIELGMQPRPDAKPVEWWRNSQSRVEYPVYRLSDCEPIIKKSLTDNQIKALKKLHKTNLLKRFENEHRKALEASKSIQDLFSQKFIILDTETTGLGHHDQIIECAIITDQGEILHNARYRPSVTVSNGAYQVHGISNHDLQNAPTFDRDAEKIRDILLSKTVAIFNAGFDIKLLANTLTAFNLDTSFLNHVATYCAMLTAAKAYGATNQYGTISLYNAFLSAGGNTNMMHAHTALGDCFSTLHVLRDIAGLQAKIDCQRSMLDQNE